MDVLIGWPGGDWQATARLAGTLVVGYLALIWLASLIWVYRDITSRTRDPISQVVSLGIGVVLPLIGIPIYLALRPPETLQLAYDREIEQEAILSDMQTMAACPSCRRPAEPSFRVCAYCGTSLKDPCAKCRELMLHSWRYCPHCATPRATASAPVAPRYDFSTGDEDYDAEGHASASAGPGSAGRQQFRRRPPRPARPDGDASTGSVRPARPAPRPAAED